MESDKKSGDVMKNRHTEWKERRELTTKKANEAHGDLLVSNQQDAAGTSVTEPTELSFEQWIKLVLNESQTCRECQKNTLIPLKDTPDGHVLGIRCSNCSYFELFPDDSFTEEDAIAQINKLIIRICNNCDNTDVNAFIIAEKQDQYMIVCVKCGNEIQIQTNTVVTSECTETASQQGWFQWLLTSAKMYCQQTIFHKTALSRAKKKAISTLPTGFNVLDAGTLTKLLAIGSIQIYECVKNDKDTDQTGINKTKVLEGIGSVGFALISQYTGLGTIVIPAAALGGMAGRNLGNVLTSYFTDKGNSHKDDEEH